MGRGTFKTGRARNRRKADPSKPPTPFPVIAPLLAEATSETTGSIELELTPTNGYGVFPSGHFSATGLDTQASLLDSSSTEWLADVIVVAGNNTVTVGFSGAVATGPAIFVFRGVDPAVRGKNGEWLGSARLDLTIT